MRNDGGYHGIGTYMSDAIVIGRAPHTDVFQVTDETVPPRPNGSLEPTGRPTALPRPELRPGRPAAQFRR